MEAEPRDLLSDLPDDILLHIFSFLQVKDILRLRILSTRFNKTLCIATPTFCFSDHYLHPHNCSCTRIFDFMFNTVPKNRPHAWIINRVSFSCFCNKPEHRNLHKQWIIQLFKAFHVDELSLDYKLPSIFSSLPKFQSLKVLKLNMDQRRSVMLPQMKLASLETLHIKSIYNLDGSLGEWISHSFPVLKHLSLQKINIWSEKQDLTIRSSSLEDLVIHDLSCSKPVRIIAQNLRTLNCFIYYHVYRNSINRNNTKFVLESCVTNLQSLTWVGRVGYLDMFENLRVTTNPRTLIMRESNWNVLIQLFKAIPSGRRLRIDTDVLRQWMRMLRTIMGIVEDSISLKNLSHLEIDVGGFINGKDFITLLERLPNLETLTLINYPNFYLKKESFEENFKGALAYCSKDGLRRTKGLKKVKLIIKEFNYNIIILLGLLMKSCAELEEIMLYYPSCYNKSMMIVGFQYLQLFETASPEPPSFHFFPQNFNP